MTNPDSTDQLPSGHDADVLSEDRFIRLSKQIAEEIIAAQARLIALERREDTPARQHETELLWRQIKTLEAKKSECESEIARLQERIRACRDARDQKAPGEPPAGSLLDAVRRKNTERALAAPAQLPFWPEAVRGVPNGILRSALFGAIKRGKRRYVEREVFASVQGIDILYTGPRLDQSDLDVWQGALHLARLAPLGNRIEFTEKSFLRLIGRGGEGGVNIGKSDRDWLKNALARLSANTVEIKQGPYAYAGSLVDEYFRDEASGRYVLVLNPRMKVMFGREGWTQIDWSLREALRGHPLAQWLHGFYSTHACPFPLKVETLHKLCGSEMGEAAVNDADRSKAMSGWRDDRLIPALDVLMAACLQVGQAFSWEITNGDLVNVSRDPSQSQRKHLQAKLDKPRSDGK